MPKTRKQKVSQHKKTIVARKPATQLEFSYSYHYHPSDWTKVVGTTIFVLMIVLFVFADQIILAGIIALAGLTLAIMSTVPTQKLKYQFDAKGLTINKRHWFWHEFRSFSLAVTESDVRITLFPIYRHRFPIVVHTPFEKAGLAHKHLSHHLPQQQTFAESLTDLFLRATKL
jgi:hypothetical protein